MARTLAAGQEPPTIVLHVENPARLSPAMLLQAEKRATVVYEAIGVRTFWVHDDDIAEPPSAALHLRLVLLSREIAEQKFARERLAENVVGEAFRDARRAYIFPDRIAAFAAKRSWDRASMLGHALAHETGHLLLPKNSHSHTGIMSANLYPQFCQPTRASRRNKAPSSGR